MIKRKSPISLKADKRIQKIPGGVRVLSYAKLNLYLEILDKRPDGYHNLETIFERVSLADEIVIKRAPGNSIRIETDSLDIPKGAGNLAYQAAELLKKNFGILAGLVIKIRKRIPVGAGLGGGSSNAASTLLGLNYLWNLGLSAKELKEYASRLGSDVAFFIYNYPLAIGRGRGERITPWNGSKKKLWHVIAVPELNVSTALIYRDLDESRQQTKNKKSFGSLRIKNLKTNGTSSLRAKDILFNRLEEVTFRRYPQVGRLKRNLEARGLINALMSGSGSAVFGMVGSRKGGLKIAKILKRLKNLKVFVAETAV
ncbi:MAG: 4-(cytidine 5'-diphospho)-2-C-methyl-D-erythritol kinase [Candidatus Omnitrophota bacterium]